MKNFEISELVIRDIKDIHTFKLKKHTTATAKLAHSALILRQSGVSTYTVGKKEYTVDSENLLFLPAGVEYELDVEKFGLCVIVLFDAEISNGTLTPLGVSTEGNK